VRFRGLLRTAPWTAVPAVVAPAVCGVFLLLLCGFLIVHLATVSSTFAVTADNGWFSLACMAAIVVLGLLIAAIAKWRRRSPYFIKPPEALVANDS
jgi:uncharacterized membrane protein